MDNLESMLIVLHLVEEIADIIKMRLFSRSDPAVPYEKRPLKFLLAKP